MGRGVERTHVLGYATHSPMTICRGRFRAPFVLIFTYAAPYRHFPHTQEQVLKVLSSEKSEACSTCRGAQRGDLLEIEYTGTLENGTVFDGSSITVSTGVAVRGTDTLTQVLPLSSRSCYCQSLSSPLALTLDPSAIPACLR